MFVLHLPQVEGSINAKSSSKVFKGNFVNGLSMTRLSVHSVVGQGLREFQESQR